MYFEAPNYCKLNKIKDWYKTVFLAGSITGAANWQEEAANKFLLQDFTVFNPRRRFFNVKDKSVEREQITWEHTYLDLSEIILFFFSHETFAPITLLELGATLESTKSCQFKKVYIAIHPEYKRKNDVIIQTELRNSRWVKNITFNLDQTIQQIIKENK